MTHFEIDHCLESMVLLVDTREQPTKKLRDRLELSGLPYERRKLNAGDYSCKCTLPDGNELSLENRTVIERKMNLDELCGCFGRERARFEREFKRAAEVGCRIYLLVEGGSWEKIYAGKYRSRFTPQALIASINAFRSRYGMQLDFCREEMTGKLIRDILYRELKEKLERWENNDEGMGENI